MQATVYRVLSLLCAVGATAPVGTNLGLVYVLWMLVSGRLLETRGAVIPGLSALGLPAPVVRRAGAAAGGGRWTSAQLLASWQAVVETEGRWQAHVHEGYQPVAVDVTGFWRPRLHDCPTPHYDGRAGRALPAIPVGVVARTGSVGEQRLGLPLVLVRAAVADPSVAAHARRLVEQAVAVITAADVLVLDRGFGVRHLQATGATRCVVRLAKNVTARRAHPPPYAGRGRPPVRGERVRPLARTVKGRTLAATPPDRVETWAEGDVVLRAAVWEDLVLPDAAPTSPTFRIVASCDPRQAAPLLLASPLPVAARTLRDLYADRWPVEQLPLAAKQIVGAGRQCVSAPERGQRLPELALLAGAVLTYAAATAPAVPTGCWDRRPRATAGRLRRVLAQAAFPADFPFPARLRQKSAVTEHLPTGCWGQRQRRPMEPASPHHPALPLPGSNVA